MIDARRMARDAARVKQATLDGLTVAQIAALIGQPIETMPRYLDALRRARLIGRGVPVRECEVAAVQELWEKGVAIRDIASRVGRPIGTIGTITARLRADNMIGLRTGPQALRGVSPPTNLTPLA